MKTRILTAIVALTLFAPVCVFSDTWILPFTFCILTAVAVYEVWRCIQSGERKEIGSFWAYIPLLLAATFTAWIPYITCRSKQEVHTISWMAALWFAILLYLFGVIVFSRGRRSVEAVATLYTMTMYASVSFACIVHLRQMPLGIHLFLLVFVGAWVSDTFAYFGGRLFGKHKLIAEISPKKTIEGSIAGVFSDVIAFVVFGLLLQIWLLPEADPNLWLFALMGVVVSVVSQIGDLIASALKRHYGIKDYGKLFPGHGGVLDRFDSVLAVAPMLLMLTKLLSQLLY